MKKIEKLNKKAQVLLETTLVFIGLTLLAIGAMRLFSNLNQNMLERFRLYKNSRIPAMNSLVPGIGRGMEPRSYLELGSFSKGGSPGSYIYIPELGDISQQDSRVAEAQLKLKEMDNILNFILLYKLNQVKEIVDYLDRQHGWQQGWVCPPYYSDYSYYSCHYLPDIDSYYRPKQEIIILCNEMIRDSRKAYSNITAAINLLKEVLEGPANPAKPYGPYDPLTCSRDDPWTCQDPRLPKYTPQDSPDAETEREAKSKFLFLLEVYQPAYDRADEAIKQRRELLKKTIESLRSARGEPDNPNDDGSGLYYLLYKVPINTNGWRREPYPSQTGVLGRLEFIKSNILELDSGGNWWRRARHPHSNSIRVLNEMLEFTGRVSPAVFSNDFAGEIKEVYNLVNGAPTEEDIVKALGKVSAWGELLYPDSSDQGQRIDLTDDISKINEWLEGQGEEPISASLDGVEYTRNICEEIASDLEMALENWPEQYYLRLARLEIEVLYEVAQINYRDNYHP
ncbi:MAG: hypothetical protein NC928_05150 [Candidatus Omnitrophica bacterium]|nr:hypothetical protein [Candidatus Omnitrophota bacterium]